MDEILDGFQGGFNGSHKRRKALRKLEALVSSVSLTPVDCQKLLCGHGKKKQGLVHLCGMVKKPDISTSCMLLVDRLQRDIPSFKTELSKVPIDKLVQMNLNSHVLFGPPTQQVAYMCVHLVMDYQMLSSGNVELDMLLTDDDAHDMYIEWESTLVPVAPAVITVEPPVPTEPEPERKTVFGSMMESFNDVNNKGEIRPLSSPANSPTAPLCDIISDPLGIVYTDIEEMQLETESMMQTFTHGLSEKQLQESEILFKISEADLERKRSILTSSSDFDPSLFLYKVHRETKLKDLVVGIKHLEQNSEDRKKGLKQLVLENFDEFVQSRQTIGHIHSLITPEISKQVRSKTKRSGKESRSLSKEVDAALDSALDIVNVEFLPLLERRKRVRKLRRSVEMLGRLEHLWTLPQQVRTLMHSEHWIEAVIEFDKICSHLSVIDVSRNKGGVFHEALNDLEKCGEELIDSLTKIFSVTPSNKSILRPSDALSLLLELRDNIPPNSPLFSTVDGDNDPYALLAHQQQSLAHHEISKFTTGNTRDLIKNAGSTAFAFIGVWSEGRVCIDPSSEGRGEHIFDVLNRQQHSDILTKPTKPISSRMKRTGSTDLLFDIRKRTAANCSLEILKFRRECSDNMSLEIQLSYASMVAILFERMEGNDEMLREGLIEVLGVTAKFIQYGAYQSASFAQARQSDDAACVLYTLITQYLRLYFENKLKSFHEIERSNVYMDKDPPQFCYMESSRKLIHGLLIDVSVLLNSADATLLLDHDFLDTVSALLNDEFIKCIERIPAWCKQLNVGIEEIPILFSDTSYIRTVLLPDLRSQMLELFSLPLSNDAKQLELDSHLSRLEASLMAQYVQQKGQGLKVFVDKAIGFDKGIETWNDPPTYIRPYSLDIISHFVNVVAECSQRIGPQGTQLLLNGLTQRLALCFSLAVESEIAEILCLQSFPGAVHQLELEIHFLRHVLHDYQTQAASDAFDAVLETILHEASGTIPQEYLSLIADMEARSHLLVSALGNSTF